LPFDLPGFRIGLGSALVSAAVALTACAVYDDSVLPASHEPGGGLGGNRGELLGFGGASATAGAAGDPRTDDGARPPGSSGRGLTDDPDGAGGSVASSGGASGVGGMTASNGGTAGSAIIVGQAGTGGTGALADAAVDAPALSEELIDDMEDGNNFIPAIDGRRGTWSVGNDATKDSEQTPGNPFVMTLIPSGRTKSSYAAHTAGHGFTGWGAVMLVTLNQLNNDPKQAYDASNCIGITFWASVGQGAASKFKIRIADADTLPEGKVCSGTGCNDHHQILATWSTTWTKYTYLFADMRQEGWGAPQKPFDAAHIYDVEFQTAETTPFDVWIDDLAFVKQ
jgi:Carbohydrate binding domain (family 11)